jgi:hypothetical protein
MGIIKTFKNYYFNAATEFFYDDLRYGDITDVNKINLKNALVFILIAWDNVSIGTIQNCFTKALEISKLVEDQAEETMIDDEILCAAVSETILEISEDGFEDDESSDEANLVVDQAILKKTLVTLNSMQKTVKLISPDSLKQFFLFRIDFLNELRRKYKFGKKVTDFFK